MGLQIPPLKAAGVQVPELETLRAELRDLSRELNLAEAEIANLEQGRSHAQHLDAVAGAKAKRTGKKDPGAKAEAKLDEELKKAKRNRDILAAAVAEVEGEISSCVAENATSILSQLSESEKALNHDQREAVATLEDTRAKRHRLLQAASWIGRLVPDEDDVDAVGGPATDTIEVINLATKAARPTDQEIARVLAWLRHEAGGISVGEFQAGLPQDVVLYAHGDEASYNYFPRQASEATAAAENGGAT